MLTTSETSPIKSLWPTGKICSMELSRRAGLPRWLYFRGKFSPDKNSPGYSRCSSRSQNCSRSDLPRPPFHMEHRTQTLQLGLFPAEIPSPAQAVFHGTKIRPVPWNQNPAPGRPRDHYGGDGIRTTGGINLPLQRRVSTAVKRTYLRSSRFQQSSGERLGADRLNLPSRWCIAAAAAQLDDECASPSATMIGSSTGFAPRASRKRAIRWRISSVLMCR